MGKKIRLIVVPLGSHLRSMGILVRTLSVLKPRVVSLAAELEAQVTQAYKGMIPLRFAPRNLFR